MSAAPPDIPALPAGLCYVDDRQPGIRRRRQGKRFVYFDADGQRIGDAEEIRRLDKLAIPPAYREVWICPDPNAISRPPAATPVGASSTVTTRAGARYAMPTSTSACCASARRCRGCAGTSTPSCACPASVATRWWPWRLRCSTPP